MPVALGSATRGTASSFSRASDNRLARRASKGDQRALAAIFERYQQELFRFCMAMLGDPDDAQDALQNTMVKVLRSLPGEEREIALRPWLYKIARNEAIELRRTADETEALDGHLRDRRVDVSEQVEQREHLGWLLRDLEELPERQRAVLLMRELSGLEFADIAAALGTSSGVVRQSLYEARRNLEQMDFGRSLGCASVTKVLSDSDGRSTRRREIRAHLRGCSNCRRFEQRIGERRQTLAAISPFPAGAAAAGVSIVKSIGGAGLLKAVTTVAVVAVVGTAVERPQSFDLGASEPAPARSYSPRAAPSDASGIESRSVARVDLGPSSLATHRHEAAVVAFREAAGGPRSEAPASAAPLAAADSAAAVQAEQHTGAKAKAQAEPEPPAKPEEEKSKPHPEQPAKPEKKAKPEKASKQSEAPGQTSEHPEHPEHPAHPAHSQKPEKPSSSSTPAASPPAPISSSSADPPPPVEDTVNGLAKGHEKKLGRD